MDNVDDMTEQLLSKCVRVRVNPNPNAIGTGKWKTNNSLKRTLYNSVTNEEMPNHIHVSCSLVPSCILDNGTHNQCNLRFVGDSNVVGGAKKNKLS